MKWCGAVVMKMKMVNTQDPIQYDLDGGDMIERKNCAIWQMSGCRVCHYVRLVQLPQIPSSGAENRNQRWQIKNISQTDKGDSQENIHHKS